MKNVVLQYATRTFLWIWVCELVREVTTTESPKPNNFLKKDSNAVQHDAAQVFYGQKWVQNIRNVVFFNEKSMKMYSKWSYNP